MLSLITEITADRIGLAGVLIQLGLARPLAKTISDLTRRCRLLGITLPQPIIQAPATTEGICVRRAIEQIRWRTTRRRF